MYCLRYTFCVYISIVTNISGTRGTFYVGY